MVRLPFCRSVKYQVQIQRFNFIILLFICLFRFYRLVVVFWFKHVLSAIQYSIRRSDALIAPCPWITIMLRIFTSSVCINMRSFTVRSRTFINSKLFRFTCNNSWFWYRFRKKHYFSCSFDLSCTFKPFTITTNIN